MLSLLFACLAITAIAAPTPDGMDKLASLLPSDWKDFVHEPKWHTAIHHGHHGHHFDPKNCSDGLSMHPSSTPHKSGASPTSASVPPHHVAAHSSSASPSSAKHTQRKSASPSSSPSSSPSPTPTPTPTPTPSTHPGNAASPTPSLSASAAAYLDPQNALRAKHSAKPLTWSSTLVAAAQKWANECKWAHSQGAVGPYGENIAAGTGNFGPGDAVSAWASEESQYNPSNPVFSHYTQIVWKGTTELGCASAACTDILGSGTGVAQFHVCEYNPPGNVEGEFNTNVS